MDDDTRATLLERCDGFLAEEPENIADALNLDHHEADTTIDLLRHAQDTPAARRLRRALENYRDAAGRFQRAAEALDAAEARARQACTELAAELRGG